MASRSRSGKAWSGPEDSLLKTLVYLGTDASRISQYLNRTTRSSTPRGNTKHFLESQSRIQSAHFKYNVRVILAGKLNE